VTREINPGALSALLHERLDGHRLVLFLDFDGTLTPIVQRPEHAVLDAGSRAALERLVKKRHPVYVISGRDLEDVRALVVVEGVHFVGSHGFHLMDALPGLDRGILEEAIPELKAAADELESWLDYIDGVLIERKKFSFALHYRQVDTSDLSDIRAAAEDVMERYGALTYKKGKKVIEFVPDIPWDKGRCVLALLARIKEESGDRKPFPVYLGDDVTDEDAFRALEGEAALTVVVAREAKSSAAAYRLQDSDAVREFLELID